MAAAELVSIRIREGKDITVLDLSSVSFPSNIPPVDRVKILKSMGLGPVRQLREGFEELGARYLNPSEATGFENWREAPEGLTKGVDSSILSDFRKLGEIKGPLWHLARSRLSRSADLCYQHLVSYLDLLKPEEVIIFNGRLADSNAFKVACLEVGVKITFVELGNNPGTLFTTDFPVHDRISLNREIKRRMGQVGEKEREAARLWLEDRVYGGGTNEFGSRWRSSNNLPSKDGKRYDAVFFSSSREEVWALGDDWSQAEWEHQTVAFKSICDQTKARGGGGNFAVRMHPNQLNKSITHFILESSIFFRAALRNDWSVFWPHDRRSSYELLFDSKLVVVSGSTIGLEAAFASIPVVTTASSSYAEVVGLPEIFSEDQTLQTSFGKTASSRLNAINYVAANRFSWPPISLTPDFWVGGYSSLGPLGRKLFDLLTYRNPTIILVNMGHSVARRVNIFVSRLFDSSFRLAKLLGNLAKRNYPRSDL